MWGGRQTPREQPVPLLNCLEEESEERERQPTRFKRERDRERARVERDREVAGENGGIVGEAPDVEGEREQQAEGAAEESHRCQDLRRPSSSGQLQAP